MMLLLVRHVFDVFSGPVYPDSGKPSELMVNSPEFTDGGVTFAWGTMNESDWNPLIDPWEAGKAAPPGLPFQIGSLDLHLLLLNAENPLSLTPINKGIVHMLTCSGGLVTSLLPHALCQLPYLLAIVFFSFPALAKQSGLSGVKHRELFNLSDHGHAALQSAGSLHTEIAMSMEAMYRATWGGKFWRD